MTASVRRRLPSRWATGLCDRGHDVTDPANVRVVRRRTGDGGSRQACLPCERARKRASRCGTRLPPAVTFPDRVCDRCGETYSKPGRGVSRAMWARRRYCGSVCATAALTDLVRDRAATGARPGPLDEATVTRLRAMVGVSDA